MELVLSNVKENIDIQQPELIEIQNRKSAFIEANTKEVSIEHLVNDTILPVFSKDNEETISHAAFINSVQKALQNVFHNYTQSKPSIRVSHIIKGRIPEAVGKPLKELSEKEKTICYERIAFIIELPELQREINGNKLSLVAGGVRAYNTENLYSKKSIEKFKVFIGFKNYVCTNLCISTDGFQNELRVTNTDELQSKIEELYFNYDQEEELNKLENLFQYNLTTEQVAHLIGKMKLYQYLDNTNKKHHFDLQINDNQISTISKNYFRDNHFKVASDGTISLWNLYNLFTDAMKSSYIDSFLQRQVCMSEFVQYLANSIKNDEPNYFLI